MKKAQFTPPLGPSILTLIFHKCIPVTPELFKLAGKYGCGPGLDIYFFVKIFLNNCSCSAILLRVQRLHISLDLAGTVKFFLSSCQHYSFSLSGTASHSSLGLEAFQSLKLIGMWSLTIHPDCLMNFLAAASGAIGSPSGPTSVIMNRPSSFFVGPRFVFFYCDDDPDGY